MKPSTVVWIIVVIVIIGGLVWWGTAYMPSSNTAQSTQTTSTTTSQTPGNSATLGASSSAALGNYLVAYNGMTLYTYAPDTLNKSNCTGACAQNWPPYTVASSANLVVGSSIAGTLGVITRQDNGTAQVTYNGRPLYFYKGDTAPNQTNGQGIGGVWYVVKP